MSSLRPTMPPGSQRPSCPRGSARRCSRRRRPCVAQHREAGAAQRREQQLAALAQRVGRSSSSTISQTNSLSSTQPVTVRAGVAEGAGLGQPGVVDAARRSPPRCAPAPRAARRPARRCRARARPSRAQIQPLLDGHLEQPQRVGRRAPDRGRPHLVDRLQALGRAHPAERDRHRADLLEARLGGPELHVRAERVGQRDPVPGPHAGDRQRVREALAPPAPVLGVSSTRSGGPVVPLV